MTLSGPTHSPFLGEFRNGAVAELEAPEEPDLDVPDLDVPTFLRRPRELPLLAPDELIEDEESPGVSAVHWAPLKPRPTTDPPSCPGVFWVRLSPDFPWRVVEVYRDDASGHLMATWSDIPDFAVVGCGYEFSDRAIVEPE
jgi:hypothetical protein